jgi:hypothetical protein
VEHYLADPIDGRDEGTDQVIPDDGSADAAEVEPGAVAHFERFLDAAGLRSDDGLRPLMARQIAAFLGDDAPGLSVDLIGRFDPQATTPSTGPGRKGTSDIGAPSLDIPPDAAKETAPEQERTS